MIGFLPSRPGQFFLKSKRRRFSKKKIKSQRVAIRFLTGLPGQPVGSHRVFYFIFFSTRPGSSSGLAESRVDLPGCTEF